MNKVEKTLDQMFFESKMGKYDVVKLAIKWIKATKDEEGYKNLAQTQLLDKAVRDVLTRNTKDIEKEIEDLENKKAAKQLKQEEKQR